MVANGQMKTPTATIELQFEVHDITFVERFIVMASLADHLIGILFLQNNGINLDMRQGILNFPFFSMKLKNAYNSYQNINGPLPNPHEMVFQPWKQTTNQVKSQILKEEEVTEILQPSQHIENNEALNTWGPIICRRKLQSMVHINNFHDQPYTLT